jgi:thioredoxin 1
MTPRTITVNDASFSTDVLDSPRPVLVDSWAPWCGRCRAVAPILEQLAMDHGDTLTVAKLDVDANPLTSRRFQVASVPTMIVFKGGIPTTRLVGARAKSALLQELSDLPLTSWCSTSLLLARAVEATQRSVFGVPNAWMAFRSGWPGWIARPPLIPSHPLTESR